MERNYDEETGIALLDELNLVRNVTNSSPRKYDAFKKLFEQKTGAKIAVCYLSDISKMWTPRVGQALLGFPDGLIVLSSDSFQQENRAGDTYIDKLEAVLAWAPRIELAVACTGFEGDWSIECIIGPQDSLVCDFLTRAFADAASRRLALAPISRLPDPR